MIRPYAGFACPVTDIIIDSDTANETDDQFAIAYALLAAKQLCVRSIHAAPFLHCRVNTAAEGMCNSVNEIRRILSYFPDRQLPVCAGALNFLRVARPEMTPACGRLIAAALACTPRKPLHVIAIAALTNIGAAFALVPEIAERVMVHWLGSNSYQTPPSEFNLEQDLTAAQLVFNSRCRLRIYPCAGMAEHLRLYPNDAMELLGSGGALGAFLLNRYLRQHYFSFGYPLRADKALSIWDLAPVAGLLIPEAVELKRQPRHHLQLEPAAWSDPVGGLEDEVCVRLDAAQIFRDFSCRLQQHTQCHPQLADCLF